MVNNVFVFKNDLKYETSLIFGDVSKYLKDSFSNFINMYMCEKDKNISNDISVSIYEEEGFMNIFSSIDKNITLKSSCDSDYELISCNKNTDDIYIVNLSNDIIELSLDKEIMIDKSLLYNGKIMIVNKGLMKLSRVSESNFKTIYFTLG